MLSGVISRKHIRTFNTFEIGATLVSYTHTCVRVEQHCATKYFREGTERTEKRLARQCLNGGQAQERFLDTLMGGVAIRAHHPWRDQFVALGVCF